MIPLGYRMKDNYENRSKTYLTRRTPVIIRLDGAHFHTFTKQFSRPFSEELHNAMVTAAMALAVEVSGCRLAYIQSDEISLLLHDYNKFDTAAWYDYAIQKVVSVTASIATAAFNEAIREHLSHPSLAYFDSRAFNLPEEEVHNYFVWRQGDWHRNSVSMLAQSLFSPRALHQCNREKMIAMCKEEHGVDWNTLDAEWRFGTILRYDAEAGWHQLHETFREAPFIVLDALEREER